MKLVKPGVDDAIEALVPGLKKGMPLTDAMELILAELQRLKKFERIHSDPAATFKREYEGEWELD